MINKKGQVIGVKLIKKTDIKAEEKKLLLTFLENYLID